MSKILRRHDARSGAVPAHEGKHGLLAGVEVKGAGETLSGKRKKLSHGLLARTRMQAGAATPLAATKRKHQDGDKDAQNALASPMPPFALRAPMKPTGARHGVARQAGRLPASKLSPLLAVAKTPNTAAPGAQHLVAKTPNTAAPGAQHLAAKTPNTATPGAQHLAEKTPNTATPGAQHLAAKAPKATPSGAQYVVAKAPKAITPGAQRSAVIKTDSGVDPHTNQQIKQAAPTSKASNAHGPASAPAFIHVATPPQETKRQNSRSDTGPLQGRQPRQTGKIRVASSARGAAKAPGVAHVNPQPSTFSQPAHVDSSQDHNMQAAARSSRSKGSPPKLFLRKAKTDHAPRETSGVIPNIRPGAGDIQAIRQWQEKKTKSDPFGEVIGPAASGVQAATQTPAGIYPAHAVRMMPTLETIVRAARKGTTRIDIQLEPAHLGKIHVVLHSNAQQQIHIHIAVEQGSSRQMIEQHLPVLRQMMAQQGLNPGNFSMDSQQHHGQDNQGQQSSFSAPAEDRIRRHEGVSDRPFANPGRGEGYLSIRI